MEINGVQHIRLPQINVWEALNNPDVIRQSIPGCKRFEQTGNSRYAVVVVSSVGPVSTEFDGTVTLFNLRPTESYTISFEGAGQGAGSVLGQADVRLIPEHLGTTLTYRAGMQVAGPLEQAGPRLLEEAATRMVEAFFARFKATVEPGAPGIAAGEARVTEVSGGLWLAPVWSFLGGFGVGLVAIIAAAVFK